MTLPKFAILRMMMARMSWNLACSGLSLKMIDEISRL